MIGAGTLARGARNGLRAVWAIAQVLVPAIIVVNLLGHSGGLDLLARWFAPVMGWMGLPGEAALVLVAGNLVGFYAGLAILAGLGLTAKQVTIVAAMLMTCHAAVVEGVLVARAGAPALLITGARVAGAVVAALALNWML